VRAQLLAYIVGKGKRESMEAPGEVFKFAASPEATVAVNMQLGIFKELVCHSTNQFPSAPAVTVVQFVLRDLALAKDQIPLQAIGTCFDVCCNNVRQHLQSLSNVAAKDLRRVCMLGERMQEAEVENIFSKIQFVAHAENALDAFVAMDGKGLGCLLGLQNEISRQMAAIAEHVRSLTMGQNQVIDGTMLAKLFILGNVFDGHCVDVRDSVRATFVRQLENHLFPKVEEEMAVFCGKLDDSLTPNPEERAVRIQELVFQLREMISGVRQIDLAALPPTNAATPTTNSKMGLRSDAYDRRLHALMAKQLADTTCTLMQAVESKGDLLHERSIASCRLRLQYLAALASDNAFAACVSVKDMLLEVEKAVDQVVDETQQEIECAFRASGHKSVDLIEQLMNRIYPICRELSPDLKARTSDTWCTLVESLSGYLKNVKHNLKGDVVLFLQGNNVTNFERLAALRGAKWMNNYKPGVVTHAVDETTKEILRVLQSKADEVYQPMVNEPHSQAACYQIQSTMAVLDVQ